MTATMKDFQAGAFVAMADIRLQTSLEGATGRFREGRVNALAELPEADGLRDHFKRIRAATLANLAAHLETFEAQATAAGAQVHWAADAAEACAIVADLARQRGVELVAKSKSMATEEIHLNEALAGAGIKPVETDLGEWIIQLAGDPPSHIIAPAIHMSRQDVADLFSKETGESLAAEVPLLTATARRVLRQQFLQAGMGISGANIGVAATGSVVLVTNEGNGRMVTSLPPVHVAIMGIEKVTPGWFEAGAWLSLLARSATGQPLSIYTSIITGPRRQDDVDGPEEVHIVLLDNGRSQLLGTEYEEVLQCIRCGACLNVCPVYRTAGGHAYGSPYSGPIGAVLSPLLFGREEYEGLPQASSLCGACLDVCPARIDLPRMLLALRREAVTANQAPWPLRLAERAVARIFNSESRLQLVRGAGRVAQMPFVRNGWIRLPVRLNPTPGQPLPSLARRSFREMWAAGEVDDVQS